MKKALSELNPEQRRAVETTEGPVLILAGAGSGKTRVLTHRIAYLIKEKGVPPSQILAVTFTKKAAGEMKERVRKLAQRETGAWIGTFHSIFSRILRSETSTLGMDSNFVIYDADDQVRLIKSVMEDFDTLPRQFTPKSVAGAISRIKNQMAEPGANPASPQGMFEDVVAKVYPEYQRRLRFQNACDFDDLILLPIWIFENHAAVLEKYQRFFQYILVDEYQDTNPAQFRLIRLLASAKRNLCVVGDDDQSIYRWRGADIRNILDFEKHFPESRVFRLDQNYRSTQNILTAANSVVENNKNRKPKKLWTDRDPGEKIEILAAEDEREEAQRVVEGIKREVMKKKRSFRDFAVLYRTNAQSRALEEALIRSSLSYVIVGGLRFYERKEIKDILAYLKLIDNPRDTVSLKRIVNFPSRGIGEGTLEKLETWSSERTIPLFEGLAQADSVPGISERIRNSIREFYGLIRKYGELKTELSPNELLHALLEETGILAYYKDDTTIEGQGRLDNVREFLAAVDDYVSANKKPSLTGFLEDVALVTDVDRWNDAANAITLMTLHSAKGLEFPVVFITGLEEGLFPLNRDGDPDAMEEERRLFYVGVTRAKDKAVLLWAQRRAYYGETSARLPSRFLEELDPNVVENTVGSRMSRTPAFTEKQYKPAPLVIESQPDITHGTRILHEVFGRGEVISVSGQGKHRLLAVRFEDGEVKRLMAAFARYQILD